MIIIGDVHEKVDEYMHLIEDMECSIQVGDFGFREAHEWHRATVDPERHKVIFGNHDYYPMVNEPHSLGHYALLDGGIMTVRGAMTLDKQGNKWVGRKNADGTWAKDENNKYVKDLVYFRRKEGVDLFESVEELNMQQCNEVMDLFVEKRPSIVISHDCPTLARNEMMKGLNKEPVKTRTDQMLQGCFEQHQPDLWIFGHYHKSKKFKINGTIFICLEELQMMEL